MIRWKCAPALRAMAEPSLNAAAGRCARPAQPTGFPARSRSRCKTCCFLNSFASVPATHRPRVLAIVEQLLEMARQWALAGDIALRFAVLHGDHGTLTVCA